MANEIKIFTNEEFGQVRTVIIDDEPWMVGKDIAAALGYKDTADALKRHVDSDDKLTRCFTGTGQSREMYIINESGMYALVLSSKLSTAKKFKHWVTSEVLPAIRKTGSYEAQPMDDMTILSRAVLIAQDQIQQLQQSNEEKDQELEIIRPQAAIAERLAGCPDYVSIAEASALIGIKGYGQNNLFRLLRDKGIIIDTKRAKMEYINRGYFKTQEKPYFNKYVNEDRVDYKLMVSQKGIQFLIKLIHEDQLEKKEQPDRLLAIKEQREECEQELKVIKYTPLPRPRLINPFATKIKA